VSYYFGAHTIDKGGIHMAVRRAANADMRALQLFSAMPMYYNERMPVKAERADRFKKALGDTEIANERVLVHAAYVLNTASPEPEKYARAKAGLAKELERTATLGAMGCCFHPGSAGASDPAGAIERVAEAITYALECVPGKGRVLVENTAGAGRTMGRTAQEIAGMLERVPPALRARTGYGLDTAHLLASGHDIAKSEQALIDTLDEFVQTIGETPSFFHLNDSEYALGSNRDRHALIGEGRIGVEPFRWLLADRRAQEVPLILETPQLNANIADDDATPDEYDVRMMRLLEKLVD
jgi:deoxyribonuclease-4